MEMLSFSFAAGEGDVMFLFLLQLGILARINKSTIFLTLLLCRLHNPGLSDQVQFPLMLRVEETRVSCLRFYI